MVRSSQIEAKRHFKQLRRNEERAIFMVIFERVGKVN